jgi:hypothetical protein
MVDCNLAGELNLGPLGGECAATVLFLEMTCLGSRCLDNTPLLFWEYSYPLNSLESLDVHPTYHLERQPTQNDLVPAGSQNRNSSPYLSMSEYPNRERQPQKRNKLLPISNVSIINVKCC